MLGIGCEYVIRTVAWRPLANTFVQASGGMSATAEVCAYELFSVEKLIENFIANFIKKLYR